MFVAFNRASPVISALGPTKPGSFLYTQAMTTCHHLHSEYRGGGRGQASHWHLPPVTTHRLADASAPSLVCSPLSLDNLGGPSAGSLLCDPSTASHLPGGGSPGCGPSRDFISSTSLCLLVRGVPRGSPPLLRPQLSCQEGRPFLTNHPAEHPAPRGVTC